MLRSHVLVFALVVACSKKESAPIPTPSASVSVTSVASPITSASGRAEGKHEGKDRHDPAVAAKLTLAVTIGSEKKTWTSDDFAKVAKIKGTSNDGNDRETWSLRDMAHTLVGPNARVTAVIGDEKAVIAPAVWADAQRTPILHTTRRGALKFRYVDAKGKWGEPDASDVTGLEITP